MNDPSSPLLEAVLRHCAQIAPEPCYPIDYVQASGVPRETLDACLDRLRHAGFVQLTDWVPGKGQGYRLTPAGVQLLESPRLLETVRNGQLPAGTGAHAGPRRPIRAGEEARAAAIQEAFTDPAHVSPVTLALIFANIAVFLAGLVIGLQQDEPLNKLIMDSTPRVLDLTGALSASMLVVRHEWWRLITCCFVHIGLVHLAVNMYSLYVIGPLLERMWGSARFLTLYLIAGLGGSCAMMWDTPSADYGAGASGAIWGVLGSMVTWIYLHRRVLDPEVVAFWRRQLVIVFVLNLGITFGIPNISKGAHLGGGLVGLVIGVPLDWLRFGRSWLRAAGAALLVLIPAACVGGMAFSLEKARPVIVRHERQRELLLFRDEIRPRIVRAIQDAQQAQRRFFDLFHQHASRRDADEVKKSLDRLAEARSEVQDLAAALKQLPPFSIPEMAKLRQLTDQLLTAWIAFFDVAQDYLRKGTDASLAEQKAVEQQVEQVQESDRALAQAFRQAVNAADD